MNRTITLFATAALAFCLSAAPAAADALSYYDGHPASWQVPDASATGVAANPAAPMAEEPAPVDNSYQDAFTETTPFDKPPDDDVWEKPVAGLECATDDGYKGGKCAPAYCWSPCWEFTFDALVLRREHTPGYALSHRVGGRLGAARSIGYCRDIQLLFSWVDQWSHTAPAVAYGTDLYSWELNWRRHWCGSRLRTLAGFRIIELDENRLTTATGVEEDIDNHLIGFQVGVEAIPLQTCRWEIETGLKAGAYHNTADYDATGLPATLGADQTAFVGEWWLGANYCMTSCIDLRFGYQAMWIEGVADMTAMAPTSVALDMSGSPFYHGLYLGAQAVW